MRSPQQVGDKGSLKWIQQLLAQSPSPIDTAVRTELGLPSNVSIDWRLGPDRIHCELER
jgi:hypothetical protein